VVPFGEIVRRDDLKTKTNQAVFDVTFFKTIGVAYPTGQTDPANAALAALELFGDAMDAEFASAIDIASFAEQQSLIDRILAGISKVASTLNSIAAVQESVSSSFQDAVDTVTNTIDTLIGVPLTMAFETRRLIQLPSRALASILAKLDGYGNLADDIFTAPDAVAAPGGPGGLGPRPESNTGVGNDSESPNKFHADRLFAANFVASTALSVLYTDTSTGGATSAAPITAQQSDAAQTNVAAGGNAFQTAGQALEAAEILLNRFDAYVEWSDDNYKSISGGNLSAAEQAVFLSATSNIDPGASYVRLYGAVALAAGFLIDLSFSLQREMSIVLDRPRAVTELVYELYGNVDESLDFFILSNDLAMDQLLEISKGRKIVYYI
jgi:hypothetical protein